MLRFPRLLVEQRQICGSTVETLLDVFWMPGWSSIAGPNSQAFHHANRLLPMWAIWRKWSDEIHRGRVLSLSDGENGFPGNLKVTFPIYSLGEDNALDLTYRNGFTTVLNLYTSSLFNISGKFTAWRPATGRPESFTPYDDKKYCWEASEASGVAGTP